MRLAVISDIHGNLIALEAVLADLDALGGADLTWVLGDLAAMGPRPAECVRRIRELMPKEDEAPGFAGKVAVIGGNTERYLVNGVRPRWSSAKDEEGLKKQIRQWRDFNDLILWSVEQLSFEDYEFLKKIRERELSQHFDGYGWVIGYHGAPGNDDHFLFPDTPDEEILDAMLDREGRLGIGGHTHRQMDRDLGRWRVVNVGSVGMSMESPGYARWGYFAFENDGVNVDLRSVPYDMDAVFAALEQVGFPHPEWYINRMNPKTEA